MGQGTRWIRGRLLGALLGAAVAMAALRVSAEPSAADRETARSLMAQGDAASERNDHRAALEAYTAADAIMAVPTTGVAVARAQERLGLLVEARDQALRVTRAPVAEGESAVLARARAEAEALAQALGPRIPSLRVEVKGAPADQLRVTIDGAELPVRLLGVPRKLNPGKHVLVATAPGHEEARYEVSLAEAASESVTLELAAARATPTPATADEPISPPEVDTSRAGVSPLVFIGFGAGALGFGVGSVTGIMSLSKASAAKDECSGNVCPPRVRDEIDASKSLATVSNVGFAVGLVGVGVGVLGLVASRGREQAPRAELEREKPRIEPVLGASYAGIKGVF